MVLLLEIMKQATEYGSTFSGVGQHPIFVWIVGGLITGFIASQVVNSRGQGIIRDILLGIVGAVIGGWIFNYFGWGRVTGFNPMSLLIGVVGGVVFLVAYHTIVRRRNAY